MIKGVKKSGRSVGKKRKKKEEEKSPRQGISHSPYNPLYSETEFLYLSIKYLVIICLSFFLERELKSVSGNIFKKKFQVKTEEHLREFLPYFFVL